MYKFPDGDQIPPELLQAGGVTVVSLIHKVINIISNKWKEAIIIPPRIIGVLGFHHP
jgi:hypothetical protein